jgi:FKBP-type peptidyl-prolyl cis-trans isomerase FkpA
MTGLENPVSLRVHGEISIFNRGTAMTEEITPSGLRYTDIETGSGETATGAGQTVIVHYTGWLEDETRFDSSRDRDEPFSFPLDCGFVIPGWDEGVKGMQVGGIRRLVIPSELGYGSQGAGGVIPPDATLVFEIELLEIST